MIITLHMFFNENKGSLHDKFSNKDANGKNKPNIQKMPCVQDILHSYFNKSGGEKVLQVCINSKLCRKQFIFFECHVLKTSFDTGLKWTQQLKTKILYLDNILTCIDWIMIIFFF